MGRLRDLPAARLFRIGLLSCCAALLVGLLLVTLAAPGAGQARAAPGALPMTALRFTPIATRTPRPTATATAKPKPTATATPKPTATATPQPTATATVPAATPVQVLAASPSATPKGAKPSPTGRAGTSGGQKGALTAAPPWLVEGLVGVFVILLGFSLIVFPIAMRAGRADRRSQPAGRVHRPAGVSGQVARLHDIPPERKEPLSREQMLMMRDSQRLPAASHISDQSTGSLTAIRLVNGVPVSLPITEAETVPQVPAVRRPVMGKIVEGTTGELPVVRRSQPPPDYDQRQG
jgi:hypothetical protein